MRQRLEGGSLWIDKFNYLSLQQRDKCSISGNYVQHFFRPLIQRYPEEDRIQGKENKKRTRRNNDELYFYQLNAIILLILILLLYHPNFPYIFTFDRLYRYIPSIVDPVCVSDPRRPWRKKSRCNPWIRETPGNYISVSLDPLLFRQRTVSSWNTVHRVI